MKQAVQGAGCMVSKSLTHVPEVGVQVWVETVAAYCADPWVGTGICLWDYRTSDLYAYTQTWHRQERGKEERESVGKVLYLKETELVSSGGNLAEASHQLTKLPQHIGTQSRCISTQH